MSAADFRFGLHVVGATHKVRRPVRWVELLLAAARARPPFDPTREQYASAFHYDRSLLAHLKANGGSSAGFAGPVWSTLLHFDLDADGDLGPALVAGRCLAATLLERYPALGEDDLEVYFSGGRSIHIGLPLLHRPDPGAEFNVVCRTLAVRLARLAGADAVPGVTFDLGNYDKVRLWRLINSRHAKTGLHKVRLSYGELLHWSADRIRAHAAEPKPFVLVDPPFVPESNLATDWRDAAEAVTRARHEVARGATDGEGPDRLNRATLDFIRDGATVEDRHRLLFSAAANLGEFDCPPRLACALLMPPALDLGLSPTDAVRQIECGLKRSAYREPERGAG